jgi:hypothetical protein
MWVFMLVLGACAGLTAPLARAALVAHVFSITGSNGETGAGRFVYDDDLVSDGNPVANSLVDTGDIVSLSIQISGGNVVGGSTSFELSDCVGAFLENSPDFGIDINFWCNNGVNSLSGRSENLNFLNDAADFGAGLVEPVLGPLSSELAISAGSTRPVRTNAIPASPLWSLLLLIAALAVVAKRRLVLPGMRTLH